MISAGIIPFRVNDKKEVEFFVGHPGGNYWSQKDYWSFLKGGVEEDEDWVDTAIREFQEESGVDINECEDLTFKFLGMVTQNTYKTVVAYALHFPNIDVDKCTSNLVEGEDYPEIDGYRWMTYDELIPLTHKTHVNFYDKIVEIVTDGDY